MFVIEYLGPIVFYAFFYMRPEFIYGKGAALKPYNQVQQYVPSDPCPPLHTHF